MTPPLTRAEHKLILGGSEYCSCPYFFGYDENISACFGPPNLESAGPDLCASFATFT
jgi:hypothetical protein